MIASNRVGCRCFMCFQDDSFFRIASNRVGCRCVMCFKDDSCSELRPIQFNSIQFSLFPAHINISYSNNNVYILCRKRGVAVADVSCVIKMILVQDCVQS